MNEAFEQPPWPTRMKQIIDAKQGILCGVGAGSGDVLASQGTSAFGHRM